MTGRLRLRLPSGQRKTPTRACKTGKDPLSQGREKWVTSKEGILTTIMARTDPSSKLNTATITEITTNYSALINWIRQALFLTLLTGSFLKLNFAYNLFIPEGLPSDHAEALSFSTAYDRSWLQLNHGPGCQGVNDFCPLHPFRSKFLRDSWKLKIHLTDSVQLIKVTLQNYIRQNTTSCKAPSTSVASTVSVTSSSTVFLTTCSVTITARKKNRTENLLNTFVTVGHR